MGSYVHRLKRPYDFRVLIDAYIYTRRRDFIHRDFEEYYSGLLQALERDFGIRMSGETLTFDQRVVWSLFVNTVGSLLSVQTPWSDYLETGLLITKLEGAGELGQAILESSRAIAGAARVSTDAHRAMLDALFVLVHGKVDRVVTSEDLQRAGFDDSKEPDFAKYDHLL